MAQATVTLPATSSDGAAPMGPASKGGMCKVPGRGHGTDWQEEYGLLFAPCEDFLGSFDVALQDACESAAPELVHAFSESLDFEPANKGESPYEGDFRDHRSHVLLEAARGRVPGACAGKMTFEPDDESRFIYEIKPDWRACPPDPELFEIFHVDYGDHVDDKSGHVLVGAYFWSLAMKEHLTPIGRQYLRKFLVCEEVAYAAHAGPEDDQDALRYVRTRKGPRR